ncbi:hypothetical protein HBH56_059770 [Parastagonospora nodorum]|nr:hypothetical protein HBH56_059770 [Parastagonospora nodorum]KAH3930981.1 hypothetical protein HBH54_103700 [Parastagonospora nodorum]KAH3954438.1 hypothetical protein HBH53_018370 [Parastagonospora nodorum]KAH3965411.1 hypothetical protein HBH51_152440 [Parastagonospora nodorum]KAH3977190.1 hypothetical protein HBH52_112770 [Parastagonospora nodorum]
MSLVVEDTEGYSGIMVYRGWEEGRIPSLRAENQTRKQEKRHMLMLRLFPTENCSPFTIVSVDDIQFSERIYVMSTECAGSLTPMILFIKYLRRLFVEYTSEWYSILAQIAKEVDPTLVLDQNLSVTYFKIFQLLRTCGNMIEETHQDFLDWHAKILSTFKNDLEEQLDAQGPVTDVDMKKMREEWKKWKNKSKRRFEELRGRFKDKQQDVLSLTESLQNFIAVNEAKQSTRQNRYVLVFTTATVIYLPLSFVTAIFSMNNIRDSSPLYQSIRPFAWTIIAVSLATYAVAGFSILHMRGTTLKAAEKLKAKKKVMDGSVSLLLNRYGYKSRASEGEGSTV